MTRCGFLLTVVMLGMSPAVRAQMPRNAPAQAPAQLPTSPVSSSASVKQDVPYAIVGGHPLLVDIYEPGEHSDLRPAVVPDPWRRLDQL